MLPLASSKGEDDEIVVRTALPADIDRIADLLSDLAGKRLSVEDASNRFDLIAGEPDQELLVADAEGMVIGLLAFRIRHNIESVSHYGEVASIVVDGSWRTKGVGRRLIDHAEALARQRKCIGLWLVSGFGREAEAHKFYDRLGFERTGVRLVKTFAEPYPESTR